MYTSPVDGSMRSLLYLARRPCRADPELIEETAEEVSVEHAGN